MVYADPVPTFGTLVKQDTRFLTLVPIAIGLAYFSTLQQLFSLARLGCMSLHRDFTPRKDLDSIFPNSTPDIANEMDKS